MSQDDRLDELYDRYQRDPKFQYLKKQSTFFVGGEGPFNPGIMLIGEAPGRLENAKRQPFQGRAGINLLNILEDVGIDAYETFRTNVIKYWPQNDPGDTRTPEEFELKEHRSYLLEEIEIVNPRIVGLCGYSAIRTIFPKIPNVYHSHKQLLDNKFVPLYHPAFSTRNATKKPLVISGYAALKEHLENVSGNHSSARSGNVGA